MTDATWRRSGKPFGGAVHREGRRLTTSSSRTAAMQSLGSVVYAARLADGTVKIGWTTHFEARMRWLSSYVQQDVELLAFRPGTYDDEQAIHAGLVDYLLDGRREFYHPAPAVMAVVNGMRDGLGLPRLAA